MNPDDLTGEDVAERCLKTAFELYAQGKITKPALELWTGPLDALQDDEEDEVRVKTVKKTETPMGKLLIDAIMKYKEKDEEDALQDDE